MLIGKRQSALPVTIRPSHMSRKLDWDRTRAFAVKDQQLTALAIVRPVDHYNFHRLDTRKNKEFSRKCTNAPKSKGLP